VHQEEVYNTDNDALDVIRRLKQDDAYARKVAEQGTAFAKGYLVKEVMMVSVQQLKSHIPGQR